MRTSKVYLQDFSGKCNPGLGSTKVEMSLQENHSKSHTNSKMKSKNKKKGPTKIT